jgi:hypothetical protein
MIRQVCTCGKSYQLKDDMIGRKVKCPACQAVFTVVPQAELVAQAELVPLDTPPAAAAPPRAGMVAARPDPLAGTPLVAGNAFGPGSRPGPAMSPLGTPWAPATPGGYSPAGPPAAPAKARVYPWWLWVAAGIAGIAAVGSLLLVVAVIIQMNKPNSGNMATNVPTAPPYMPDGPPLVVSRIEVGPFAPDSKTIGADFGNWQVYTSDAGGYSINLPGKPQISPRSMNSPLGRIEENQVEIGGRSVGLVVTVSHIDLPIDTSKLPLDEFIESTVGQYHGKVFRATDVQIAGRAGREILVDFALTGSAAEDKGLYRVLGVSGRIYALGYVTPAERFDEATARQCLDSFAITKEPPSTDSAYAPLVAGSGVPLQRQVAWVTHESKSGGFKVDMPATPTNVSAHVALPRNSYAEGIASEVLGKGAFVVSANRHGRPILPEGLPSFVESLRMAMSSHGKIVSKSSTSQGDFTVHDFAVDTPDGSRQLIRFYISTEWYYDLTWFGPAAESASEETKRFFASFTLMPPAGTP